MELSWERNKVPTINGDIARVAILPIVLNLVSNCLHHSPENILLLDSLARREVKAMSRSILFGLSLVATGREKFQGTALRYCNLLRPGGLLLSSSLLLLLLPLLRRQTPGSPCMDSCNLSLERIIHQPVSCQKSLLLELRRHDDRIECLAAAS